MFSKALYRGYVNKRTKEMLPAYEYIIKNSQGSFKTILILCSILISISLVPLAFGQSIAFDSASYTLNDGAVSSSPNIITVTHAAANLNSAALDTVSITVTSTTDPSGITLILTETGVNSGTFQNTNLIFTTGNAQYTTSNTVTVSITDNSQNADSLGIDTTIANVNSTADPSGISLTLSETSINSGVFKGTLAFTTGMSSGNTIQVADGNIISVTYPVSGEISNGLIIPNPNGGLGAIQATVGDAITATYLGVNDVATILSSGPGGGGGGPIRAGLVVDSILSGGGCKSDCLPPTLGITRGGQRLVDNGFSYNGNPVNAEEYYTPYPLITVEVGKPNVAKLKIYENSGSENIRHVELGFGLGKNQVISQSKAIIEHDINFDGTTKTSLFDPQNALDDVVVTSQPIKCKLEDLEKSCVEFSFHHTFRESLDFNMVGTNVWDYKRNGWQNYFNDGVEIIGDSLNPPKQIQVLDRTGYPQTITLTSKDVGIDKDGNFWHLQGNTWKTEYKLPLRDDPITMHGIDRDNNKFNQYLQGQILLAEKTFDKIVQYKMIQNPSFRLNDNFQISQNETEDKKLEQRMIQETRKAENIFSLLWPNLSNWN